MPDFRSRSAARLASLSIPVAMLITSTGTAAGAAPAVAPLLPMTAGAVTAAPDEYVVVLKDAAGTRAASDARQQVRRQAIGEGGAIQYDYGAALNGFAATLPPDALAAVRRHPDVAYVQPNLVHQQPTGGFAPSTVQPNAPWHLDRIDQRNLPMDTQYTYTSTGDGVHAYVIDTGIRSTHTEFGGRVVSDFTSIFDGNGTEDCNNHGTFVASEVGGATYGVAKEVTLHAVRVLNCSGTGTTAEIVAGMDWVADHHLSPNVANISIQSFGGVTDVAMDQAAAGMIDAGVNLVLIVGNFNTNDCQNSPKDSRALIVGATTSGDARNTGPNPSSYGPCVDVWAPGAALTGAGSAHDWAVLSNW